MQRGPLKTFITRSGTTWLIASFTLPDNISGALSARLSPMPTQLKGRTIVYGSWYCSQAPRAKYSHPRFWKSVSRNRRRRGELRAFRSGKRSRALEDHRGGHDHHALQVCFAMSPDCGIEAAAMMFVFRAQVVRKLMKVRDAPIFAAPPIRMSQSASTCLITKLLGCRTLDI